VNPAASDNYAIQFTSKSGHSSVIHRLLQDKRVDPSADYNMSICIASINGHFATVDRLLADGRVNPAAQGNTPICEASSNGHFTIVKRLLQDERVDPAAQANRAVGCAVHQCHTDIAELLLNDHRVDANAVHVLTRSSDTPIRISDAPNTGMLHLLARTLPLPFPASSPLMHWQPQIRRYRYQQLLRMETLIASEWQEGEHRAASENVIAQFVLGVTMQEYRDLDGEYDEAKVWEQPSKIADLLCTFDRLLTRLVPASLVQMERQFFPHWFVRFILWVNLALLLLGVYHGWRVLQFILEEIMVEINADKIAD
jgi:hypothetical protein